MATQTADTTVVAKGYARPDSLVSTDWLAAHLDDPTIRIIESDEDVLLYDTGHIPGAFKVDWHTDLNDPIVRDYVSANSSRSCCVRGTSTSRRRSFSTATRTTGGPRTRSGSSSCSDSRMPSCSTAVV